MKSLVEFIYEMLKSHDTNVLKEKIDDLYQERLYSSEIIEASPEKLRIIKLTFNNSIDFYSKEAKLKKYIKYYNYFVTWRRNYNNKHEVYIEPTYSDSISDKVYNDFNGIVYHVTKTEYLNKILQSGLRQKETSPKTYRYIPKKTYFSCGDSEENVKSNMKYISDEMFSDYEGELTVLKIDLNNHDGIEFYADPAFGSSKNIMCYAFVNIPKELIIVDKKMTKYINNVHSNT